MTERNNLWAGHHVRLRAVTEDDWTAFHEDGQDSEAARFGDDIKLPGSPQALRERIRAQATRKDNNAWLAVESLNESRLVGSVTVHGVDPRHRSFEYGIAIFRAERRQGFAAEAVRLLLRYYFRELGYHRANATVYAFNQPSLALQEALGFVEEGRLRESYYTNGRFFDEVVFGMLDGDFAAQERLLPALPFEHLDD